MKTLTLLRHAKSGWDDPGARDFDRTLSAKGRRAAGIVGQHLRREGTVFDHVVASPAVRVTETLAALADGYGAAFAVTADRRLYLASATTLLDVIHSLPTRAAHALLVGHNPGLEDLVLTLAAEDAGGLRDVAEQKYPTGTLATLTVTDGWAGYVAGAATLTAFTRPRDLDASLGPDED